MLCKGQKAVAPLSLLGCGQLLPDVLNLPPWATWMDFAAFNPTSTAALCLQASTFSAGGEAWHRQGSIQCVSVATGLRCLHKAGWSPCPGLSPASTQGRCQFEVPSLASELKLPPVKIRTLPGLRCQVYPGLMPSVCSPGVGLERSICLLLSRLVGSCSL